VRIAPLAALILVAASCSSAFDSGPISATGTYTLVRLDGAPLPAAIATGFTVRGSIELKSNTHYTLSQTDSVAAAPSTNTSVTGAWSISENALQLVPDGGGLLLGIFVPDTIRMDYRGHQNVYVRH
jgi:hypothetical protein